MVTVILPKMELLGDILRSLTCSEFHGCNVSRDRRWDEGKEANLEEMEAFSSLSASTVSLWKAAGHCVEDMQSATKSPGFKSSSS